MEYGLYQGLTAGTHELIGLREGKGSVKQISICNAHVSNAATKRLFLHDGSDANDTSIVEALVIPSGVTLLLDHIVSFDNNSLALKIAITGTVDLNIIIK